jgi:flagellar basal-body rod protein FlgB
MTMQDMPLMDAAIQKMHWHEARQKALAQNIANADTPHYRPVDVPEMDFKDLLKSSTASPAIHATSLATTNDKHIAVGGGSAPAAGGGQKKQKNPYETAPAGNAVILEEQLLKMNQNFTDHRLTTTIYQKNMDMLKSATRG